MQPMQHSAYVCNFRSALVRFKMHQAAVEEYTSFFSFSPISQCSRAQSA